ncbi:MAG: 4Fe-4S dicluster domain-containing protein [Fibrella sp.]|nr:4Fe-4S dicluster domain-containing protein [Armatimonadota bacterium]
MTSTELEAGLLSCVHCGFCLPACPTYRETGDEADSPRGRLVLMREAAEGKLPLSNDGSGSAGYHLDRCLGCRACETACPSGVPYGILLEEIRDRQERETRRGVGETVLREGMLALLTNPARMKAALVAGRITKGAIPAPVARFVGLPTDTKMPIPDDFAVASRDVATSTPATGARRGKVLLATGCVMRVLYGPVHAATVRVLAVNGIETIAPKGQPCCGALHGHQGKLSAARRMAKTTIEAYESVCGGAGLPDVDAVILNSSGCGAFMKGYGHLLAHDTHFATRAASFCAKVKDISEYLAALPGGLRPMPTALPIRLTYHDACHLRHGQKIYDAPRQLLKAIPGVTFVETVDSDLCCGSAGVYNYLQPEMARSLLEHKVANLLATGAEVVATGNPGCLAWIEQGMAKAGGKAPEVVHPIELLDRAYSRR